MKKVLCAYLLLIGIVLIVLMASLTWSGSYDTPKFYQCHQESVPLNDKQRRGEREGLLQKYRHLIAGWIRTEQKEAHPGWTDLEFLEHAEEILSKVQNKKGKSPWKTTGRIGHVRKKYLLKEALHEVDINATQHMPHPFMPKEMLHHRHGWRRKVQWRSKLDQHGYRYLINPENRCKKSANITLLVLIKNRMDGRKLRDTIRKTYGEGVVKYNVSAMIIFLVGTTKENNRTKQAQLQEEAFIHGDILQEDFIDSYHNLTIKLIMGFKWASTFCRNFQYVMSTDDDVVVDIVNLANDLANAPSEFRSKFVLAAPAIGWNVPRDTKGKWYTPPEFYSEAKWPPFPRGYAYIVSKDVGYKVYRESQKFAALAPWDDVYCGFLLQRLGVEMTDMGAWFKRRHDEKQKAPLTAEYAFFGSEGDFKQRMWQAIIEGRYQNVHNVSSTIL